MVTHRPADIDAPRPISGWVPLTLSNGKRELSLRLPWMNAAATLGFSIAASPLIDPLPLGAFITHPISLSRREPAGGPRFVATPGGFVLHTGLPNPGLRACIGRYRRRWASLDCPVIVHLIADRAGILKRMIEMLEPIEEVAAVEIGLPDADPAGVADLIGGAASRELPVLARLPLNAQPDSMRAASDAGAVGISLAAPRAALPGPGGTTMRGRFYGPAVFPLALEALLRIRAAGLGAPILAAGGIYRRRDLQTMLDAGASAVQLDGVLWTRPEAVVSAEPSA